MPLPVEDLGQVLAHLVDVLLVLDELVVYLLDEIRAAVAQLGQVLDRVLDQVEAVDLVLHPHVKRGGDGASSW